MKPNGQCTIELAANLSLAPYETIKVNIGFSESYDDTLVENREAKYYELLELTQLKLLEALAETEKSIKAYKKSKKEKLSD